MKRIVALMITVMMVCTIVPAQISTAYAEEKDSVNAPITSAVGGAVWDCIYFGEYPQSADGNGGYITEPIKWRVLSVDDNKACLISDKILDAKAYNETGSEYDPDANGTWGRSSLRNWLNGYFYEESFLNTAFTEEQQNAILTEDVKCDYIYEAQGEKEVDFILPYLKDKVRCLSYTEVENPENGFIYEKAIKVTDYAKSKNLNDDSWWLKTTGYEDTGGLYINYYEEYDTFLYGNVRLYEISFQWADNEIKGVRPVINVDLSKAEWEPAGTVVCGGDGIVQNAELKDPVVDSNGVTTWDCIYFGEDKMPRSFYVDHDDMKWKVLSVDGNEALLISDTTIDICSFNTAVKDKDIPTTWEDSILRKYLNGSFITRTFTETEQKALIEKKITNPDNPKYETDSGKATKDKVYVLSVNEAKNDNYGFRNTIRKSDTRSAEGESAAYREPDWDEHEIDYECNWWLRTTGKDSTSAAYVCTDGTISLEGANEKAEIGIRPVITLDLSYPVWRYAGTETAGKIGSVRDLKVASTGTNSVTLKWSDVKNADGYQIYKYNSSSKKYVLCKTVKDTSDDSCVIKNLNAGTGYKFKVRAYMDNKPVYSGYSKVVSAITKPLRVMINKPTTGSSHYVKVTWKKRTCTGYEIKLATNSKFTKGVKNYKVTSSKTLSKKMTGLKKGKTYYVKVRAYKTFGGKTKYGQWSKYKKIKCK